MPIEPQENIKSGIQKLPSLDYDNDHLVQTTIILSEDVLKELSMVAVEKGVSKASIIRDLLKDYLSEISEAKNKNLIENPIDDKELQELLDNSKTDWGDVATTGNNGIFENFAKNKWKFSNLNTEQFSIVCQYLKAGYEHFFDKPSVETFISYTKTLEPTDEQNELLSLYLEGKFTFGDDDKDKTVEEILEQVHGFSEK